MKVLLVGEASGVHRNLKLGLTQLGVECLHITQSASTSWKWYDDTFSPDLPGVLGGVARNVSPFLKIAQLGRFDVANYVNTITAVHGTYTKYFDIPLMRRKVRLMSYYALGCDEIGLIRRNPNLPYSPCATCLASCDTLASDCASTLNPIYERSEDRVRNYFDFGACSVVEYSHVERLFGRHYARIQFPVDAAPILFVPARAEAVTRIIHTPTRRGFKGTDVVLRAIELLNAIRSDFEFRVVEGLAYPDYLKAVQNSDIVIDQVHGQSSGMNGLEMLAAGKIVYSGATELGRSFFPFGDNSPVFDASPNADELAASLSAVLDRKDEFPALAAAGRQYILDHHDPVLVARLFLDAWTKELALREGSRAPTHAEA
jgi:hypothetical protein